LHWLIVIPLYFFAALALLLLSILIVRLLRLRVSVNPLVTGAVIFALALIVAPVVAGWVTLDAYTGRSLLVLILATFAIAALDTLLRSHLPIPLDKELEEL
jgi:xanthine/uracil permease